VNCVIINRNYPPQSGITGSSANELARYLISRKVEVYIVHVGGYYSGGGNLGFKKYGNSFSIKTFYNGKNNFLRLIVSLVEGRKLLKKAISLKPDIIISMTDPPLLNYWTSYYSEKHHIPWFYWSMDLYPEAFVSAGLLNKTNFIYKKLINKLKARPPKLIISLGKMQSIFIKKMYGKKINSVILPCGISSTQKNTTDFNIDLDDKIIFCYAGNLGEAHDENFVREVIKNIDPTKHIFILAVYGSKANSVIDFAKSVKGIKIVKNIKREHMHLVDIHIVSLKSNWDHVCVPSKAISAITEGSTVLFGCSKENDNWVLLEKSAWRIDKTNLKSNLRKFMNNISKYEVEQKRKQAEKISKELLKLKEDSFNAIYKNIYEIK
jgi:glycosyltransferase involved in cell wall biosynthesis